ncbi:Pentatricopeptide repeat [Macleaya cordata]|uniref:Pentatricopeptide repeat n=1 Tax=Macleaya cordata TaxID=56857 RepID=A0A200QZ18_MACCD|nr:Pentatricopeptide repeat [Macleaya cordata]
MIEGRSSSSSSLLLTTPTSPPRFPSPICNLQVPSTKTQAPKHHKSPPLIQPLKIKEQQQHQQKKKSSYITTTKTQRFSEKDAFPLSLPLHTKNPPAIYKDIQNFARQNKLKEALTILDYLDKQGIPVNPTTFSSLLSACVRSKSLIHGRQIHTYININGLEDNEFLRTKLVHMYTSCGSIEDAERVLDEIPSRETSVYPWNALLRGNVVHGGRRYRQVLDTYSQMRQLGVQLNVYTFSCLIKSFAGSSALTQGMKSHALLIKNGFLSGSILLQTSLIDMYFKCGKIKLARQVFEEIPERDVVVWGAMIAGFAHNRLKREALEYLRWMISEGIYPNSVILTTILPVMGELWALKLGQEIHGYVIKTKSYSKQLFIQSGLIDMYCKCKDLGSGRRVFYASKERNAVSWTALMSGYVSNGRLDQALRSITWMQQEGVKPDVVTVATVLPVCAELKALKQGKEIHGFVVKNGFLPNVSIVTSLMVMYSRCGILEYSCKLFDGMEKKNVISWTAMIDSYLKNRCLDEALAVFRSMQLSKHRPDSIAISRVLSACGELDLLKLGKELHGHVLKKDFDSIPFISAEIVKMYGRCGQIETAKMVFDMNPCKGSMTWTAIIEAYGCNGRYRDALDIFYQVGTNGFSPNHFTFKVLLSICDRAGLADEAKNIFNSMTQRYKIKASEEHYSSIIGLLTRLGRSEEAERFIHLRSLSASR